MASRWAGEVPAFNPLWTPSPTLEASAPCTLNFSSTPRTPINMVSSSLQVAVGSVNRKQSGPKPACVHDWPEDGPVCDCQCWAPTGQDAESQFTRQVPSSEGSELGCPQSHTSATFSYLLFFSKLGEISGATMKWQKPGWKSYQLVFSFSDHRGGKKHTGD